MELLEGEPLGARLSRGPLSPVDSSAISLQVLDALAAVHAPRADPPRPETVQPLSDPARREAAGLRPRPAGLDEPRHRHCHAPDRSRRDRRHAQLHGAGAGPRRGAGCARRPLRDGGDVLRDAVGPHCVRWRDDDRRAACCAARTAAGAVGRRHGGRARPGDSPRAAEAAERSLRIGGGDGRRQSAR